ncbi:MAG: hypothetical protein WBO25_08495 [Acidimicrobiia bacterium]
MKVDQELRSVMRTVVDVSPEPPLLNHVKGPGRRVSPVLAVAAAFAVVLLLGAVPVLLLPSGGSSDVLAGEADPLAHAQGEYPHLLMDRPGWTVVRVHEQPSTAEYEYRSESEMAGADLSIDAGDQPRLDALITDRMASASDTFTTTMFGRPATMTRYEDSDDWAVMWLADDYVYELRAAPFGSKSEMESFAADLAPVEREAWVEALDGKVVLPEHQGKIVADMMQDVPLPPGFDTDRMSYDDGLGLWGIRLFVDRYQLGAHVTGAASCAWIEHWIDAKESGDAAGIADAAEAMATSHQWAILNEMESDGGHPEVVWMIADAMATVDGRIYPDIPEYEHWTIENWTDGALGCDTHYPPSNP